MHTGHRYTVRQVLFWTHRGLFLFLLIAALPTVAYELLGWHHLVLPWLPIALVGTAVAFVVGFKNNATYDRLWEARKIWGAIVNVSRTWAIQARDLPMCPKADEASLRAVQRRLVLRHVAWLTALRYQLRQPRGWESMQMARNREFASNPFEGGANDIPMAALSRTIEIDLLQMIGEPQVPEPLKPVNDILM